MTCIDYNWTTFEVDIMFFNGKASFHPVSCSTFDQGKSDILLTNEKYILRSISSLFKFLDVLNLSHYT